MKIKTSIILIAIALVVGATIMGTLDRTVLKCGKTSGSVKIAHEGEQGKPTYKVASSIAAASGIINITGAMREGKFFTTRAENNYMSVERTYELAAICPVSYRPYSLMLQGHVLAGYNKQIEKFNVVAGGTISWIWNFRPGSVGIGVTYLRGLIVPEDYVGATITGLIDIGPRKS